MWNNFYSKFKNYFFGKKNFFIISLLIFLFFFFIYLQALPPKTFEKNIIFEINEGENISEISKNLESQNIIKSSNFFVLLITGIGNNHAVAGRYLFEKPETVFEIVRRIAKGDYGVEIFQITFYEGMTNLEMAKTIEKFIPDFDTENFLKLAQEKEGYLFPDTYKISYLMTPEKIIKLLNDNFNRKIKTIEQEINESKYSLEQIIIMASIIEREADANSRQEVSNILWKRYENDLPLQVDAPFVYYIGKGTFDLTKDDLNTEHPFNTYKKKGLIPKPIANPGLESIKAATSPQNTKNLYFLTGQDGQMYYGKTFEEHKKNRALYLD
jgi:UPF0755 protein